MSILDKIKKRRVFPVDIDGETIHVAALSKGDLTRLRAAPDSPSLVFGICLVDEKGNPVFTQNDGESDADFGKRVDADLDDVPEITKIEIVRTVNKVSGFIPDDLAKNSETTANS